MEKHVSPSVVISRTHTARWDRRDASRSASKAVGTESACTVVKIESTQLSLYPGQRWRLVAPLHLFCVDHRRQVLQIPVNNQRLPQTGGGWVVIWSMWFVRRSSFCPSAPWPACSSLFKSGIFFPIDHQICLCIMPRSWEVCLSLTIKS